MLQRLAGYLASDVAVDLGTANTRIGVAGEGLLFHEPSLVAVERDSRRILGGGSAVGHLARQMLGRTPESIRVIHPVQSGVVADFQMCEALLGYLLRKAQRHTWQPGPRMAVAVPGSLTPVERRALYTSALRAGARQVFTVPQPLAAAVGSGLPVAEPLASMLVDIGGGTSEVAVISMADLVASQSIRVAGDAMDRAIVDYLRRHYSLRIGTSAAERLRIELGSAAPLEQELTEEISGVDTVSGLPRKAVVTSEAVREALEEPLDRIVDAIKLTLDACSPDLAADLADQGMVLCGGGCLLRNLDEYLSLRTGIPARRAGDPLDAVGQGTLLCLEQFDRWRSLMTSSDEDS